MIGFIPHCLTRYAVQGRVGISSMYLDQVGSPLETRFLSAAARLNLGDGMLKKT